MSDQHDGTEVGADTVGQQNSPEVSLAGVEDTTIPIEWFKDTSNGIYTIGQLKFKLDD